MRRTDALVAGVALATCAAAFALTYRFTATTPAAIMSGMGAEFFPRLVIAVIALLAICILFGFGNPPMERPPPVPARVWVTAGVLLAFVGAVELLGMWAASFLLMVGLGRMWGEKNVVKLSAAAASLLAAIYFIFVRVLKGNFPEGIVARLWS
jgi:hypothetical protein